MTVFRMRVQRPKLEASVDDRWTMVWPEGPGTLELVYHKNEPSKSILINEKKIILFISITSQSSKRMNVLGLFLSETITTLFNEITLYKHEICWKLCFWPCEIKFCQCEWPRAKWTVFYEQPKQKSINTVLTLASCPHDLEN